MIYGYWSFLGVFGTKSEQKSLIMASETHWSVALISKARQCNPNIPDAAWNTLEALLNQHQLPAGEVAKIAKLLIEEMVAGSLSEEK